jgi:hypothetical protein
VTAEGRSESKRGGPDRLAMSSPVKSVCGASCTLTPISQRSPRRTQSGRSAWAAGTGHHAPELSFRTVPEFAFVAPRTVFGPGRDLCSKQAGRSTISPPRSAQSDRRVAISVIRGCAVVHSRGGRRSCQGVSISSSLARRNNRSSPNQGPTSCKPTGRPASVNPAGADKAGWPVRLNG